MGAINYKTSEMITLATNYNMNEEEVNCIYYEAKSILQEHDFEFFKIELEGGYYEGVQVVIETNYYFADATEKKNAQKELTQVKEILKDLIEIGFYSCVPSWCSTFKNYQETKKELKQAIKKERQEISKVSTDPFYYRDILENVSFILKGRTYLEKKENARELAMECQKEISRRSLSYYEIYALQRFFERTAEKYGLKKEFVENGIV